jgi:hypothetical protein
MTFSEEEENVTTSLLVDKFRDIPGVETVEVLQI